MTIHEYWLLFLNIIFLLPEISCNCTSLKDFPGGSDSKESACNAGDPGSIPESGRSLGEGNGNHSSIFAWRIPWRWDPGRLQSMSCT